MTGVQTCALPILIGGDVARLHGGRECVAGAVEDLTALRRDLLHPQALVQGLRGEGLPLDRLQLHQARSEDAERCRCDQQEGSRAAPRIRQCERTGANGTSTATGTERADLDPRMGAIVRVETKRKGSTAFAGSPGVLLNPLRSLSITDHAASSE